MPQLYAGDLEPTKAYEMLKADAKSLLVDVRTKAEWLFVGYPDIKSLGKEVLMIEWREFPHMERNNNFVEQLAAKIPDRDVSILFLCRTGGRSQEAAMQMTQAGYSNCYNIAYGFEGAHDSKGHRGLVSGWKASKLPWRQD